MPTGSAFLALWNDVEHGREAEYDAWHTREHVPERVSAPGFRSGRRFVDRAHPVHRYFTLYDVDDIAAFGTPEYLDLLRHPTPWSAAMRPSFRNFLRVPCLLEGSAGFGVGAALAVLRTRCPAEAAGRHLAAFVAGPGVVAARLGRRVEGTPAVAWRGTPPEPGAERGFDRVLLIEALDRAAAGAAFEEACRRFGDEGAPAELGGIYDLAFSFPGGRPDDRPAHRRPGWGPPPSAAPAADHSGDDA